MEEKPSSDYNCSDVEMLMTSQIIAESFTTNITFLSEARTDWTPEYAAGLKTRVSEGLEKLGIDSKKDLRKATQVVNKIMDPAKKDLAFFKAQILDDFKALPDRKDEILRTLGFTDYLRKVQKRNQEALIQLLFAFKTNMTAELRTEIIGKGTKTTFIDKIVGYGVTLNNANVTQETFKGSSAEVTKEVRDALNAIYREIIGICKKAIKVYAGNPTKKNLFTFSKVLKQLGAPPPEKKEPTPPASAQNSNKK
jgi:hypothetical protein